MMKARFIVLLSSVLLLTFCAKNDPCPTCLNGGLCVSGACECPEGFIGIDCGGEQEPVSMFIEEVEITRFPSFERDGSAWDLLNSQPDLTFSVGVENASSYFYNHSQYFENAVAGQSLVFRNLSIKLDNPGSQRYVIHLFDVDDLDADDSMGGVIFQPYQRGQKFPQTLDLDPSGGAVAFKLKVRYDF